MFAKRSLNQCCLLFSPRTTKPKNKKLKKMLKKPKKPRVKKKKPKDPRNPKSTPRKYLMMNMMMSEEGLGFLNRTVLVSGVTMARVP